MKITLRCVRGTCDSIFRVVEKVMFRFRIFILDCVHSYKISDPLWIHDRILCNMGLFNIYIYM
jgi:hypothetical protein